MNQYSDSILLPLVLQVHFLFSLQQHWFVLLLEHITFILLSWLVVFSLETSYFCLKVSLRVIHKCKILVALSCCGKWVFTSVEDEKWWYNSWRVVDAVRNWKMLYLLLAKQNLKSKAFKCLLTMTFLEMQRSFLVQTICC